MARIKEIISKDGTVRYYARVRIKGFPSSSATFVRKTDANRWASKIETEIRDGRYFKNTKALKQTLGELIDRYNREVLSRRRGRGVLNDKHYLAWWKAQLGKYSLTQITPSLIVETRNKLVGTANRYGRVVTESTANRYTISLGHVFQVAMLEWEVVQDNPVRKIKKFKEAKGRVRFLSDEEREKLLQACQDSNNGQLFIIVMMAISTGCRKNELLTLKWSEVDFDRQRIILNHTKNGERRSVPVRGKALQMLHQHFENRNTDVLWVFPREDGKLPIDIRTAWENAVQRSGIENFRFHDLRHTTASYLAMNSASVAEIAEVLGHKTLQMVKRYTHLSESHTGGVLERMTMKVFGEVS
jgi:integrase